MIVRAATDADDPALVAFMAALQAEEIAFEPNRMPPEEMAAPHVDWLLGWVESHEGSALIAEEDGTALGFAIWCVEEELGCYVLPENHRYTCITDLYVAPGSRRRGVARALVDEVTALARAAGVKRLEISTLARNSVARQFYETIFGRAYAVSYAKSI